jgi:hypothetical protein
MIIWIFFIYNQLFANSDSELKVKSSSFCELDLNADGQIDMAFLAESKLFVFIKEGPTYKSQVLSTNAKEMKLFCQKPNSIKETKANKQLGKTIRINSDYLKLVQPESSGVVFYWKNSKFEEVWIAD